MSLQTLCNQTVTTQVKAVTTGDAMGMIETWSNVSTNVKCRIQPDRS